MSRDHPGCRAPPVQRELRAHRDSRVTKVILAQPAKQDRRDPRERSAQRVQRGRRVRLAPRGRRGCPAQLEHAGLQDQPVPAERLDYAAKPVRRVKSGPPASRVTRAIRACSKAFSKSPSWE